MENTKPSISITGGLVLLPDGSTDLLDLGIRDGRIASIGPTGPSEQVIDARGCLVVPGLINTHCHSNENYFKGCFDNLPLELWMLFSYPILSAPRQSAREIYVRTLLGCIEMLKTGTTAVVDFLYEMPETTPETVAAVLQAYLDAGMRVLLVVGYADKVYYETVPIAMELLTPELRARIDAEPLCGPDE